MKIRETVTKERLKKAYDIGFETLMDPYYQGFAAQMAFFFLLSIIPLVGLLSQVLGLFDISLDYLRDFVSHYVKFEVADILTGFLEATSGGFSSIVMALIALWAASKAQFAMDRLTNYTLTNGQTTGMYVKERLRSFINIIILIFTIVFSLIVLVYGDFILKLVFGAFIHEAGIDYIWGIAKWVVAAGLYFFMIAFNYYMLPSKRIPFKKILPGTVLASVGLLVITWGYSQYMVHVSNYDILYGSLASIVALLFWFYLISWVIFLGILINKCWYESGVK